MMAAQNRQRNPAEHPVRFGMGQEVRRFHSYRRLLNKILSETQKALKDVEHLEVFPLESEISDTVRLSREKLLRPPALVVMGPARARLVNFLLGETLLPPKAASSSTSNQGNSRTATSTAKGWRWLRLQHGPKKQIRLTFGSDIEVVEPSLFMESSWEQIPCQILKRTDALDLSTIMDIDICNPLLEQGLQMIVPPDLCDISMSENHGTVGTNPTTMENSTSDTRQEKEFIFPKKGYLLENIFPVILYALDHVEDTAACKMDLNKIRTKMKQFTVECGNDNFNFDVSDQRDGDDDNIVKKNGNFLNRFKDFSILNNFNKKFGTKTGCDNSKRDSKFYIKINSKPSEDSVANNSNVNVENSRSRIPEIKTHLDGSIGLSDECLLDLRQIYELHPTAQVLFVFFSNALEPTKDNSQISINPSTKMTTSDNNFNATQPNSLANHSSIESQFSLDNRYLKSDSATMATSDCSSFTSQTSDYMKNFSPLECEHMDAVLENGNEEKLSDEARRMENNIRQIVNGSTLPPDSSDGINFIDHLEKVKTGDKLMSNSSDSATMFVMDEDKETLLDRQRTYLAALVQQLGMMTHPLSKTRFTGHWIIVDDSQSYEIKHSSNSMHDKQQSPQSDKQDRSGSDVMQRNDFMSSLVTFTKGCLQNYILDDCTNLSEIHNALLQQFILSSFDMAREMQIVPRRIQYVAEMEQHLYDKLLEKFTGCDKREELHCIIERVLQDMRNSINALDWAGPNCRGSRECINLASSVFYSSGNGSDETSSTPVHSNKSNQTTQLRDYSSNADILDNITRDVLKDYHLIEPPPKETTFGIVAEEVKETYPKINPMDQYAGSKGCQNVVNFEYGTNLKNTLTSKSNVENALNLNVEVLRGVDSMDSGNFSNDSTSNSQCSKMSFKQASLDVQRIVLAKLSRNISVQLVNYVDCLRDSYFGTLQRCLEALEEGQGMRSASEAVRRILLVTRSVDLQQCASFSFLSVLVDQIRRFFQSVLSPFCRLTLNRGAAVADQGAASHVGTASSCCVDSPKWRKQVALDTVDSLNATKLCRIISTQLKERVRVSHEQFQSALQTLSEHHSVRLQQTEELKITVRKRHAPRFARLCLESTSLADLVKYGFPHLGKEIGRGQYGVVYAVKSSWAGFSPLAVKSVAPPDERHFNDLAMEFFHTRSIPPHDRIVRLVGSVIDHTYGGGGGLPAVLLVSERLKWDLQCALAHGNLLFPQRMQIAVDIVEGIRYLHSQGLVHRDIKLKNVLLNEDNRAKLTDLGFCIAEAMISGSVVGTPVHMAPELLNGFYDYSVDVYAFGILFWYVCAGHVKIPSAFEHFQNKEQLWCNVRKGLRPERLPIFSDVCWDLMRKCWSGDPNSRPLLGDVQPLLEHARDHPEEHILGYVPD